ncbi:MAG TPA: hypothetical protein VEF76_00015 [Patescibacteria group bacterium]|nr:hypothetical protein [Patescibacteria group bacterium]
MAEKNLSDIFPRMSVVEKQGRLLRALIPQIAGLVASLDLPARKSTVPFLPPESEA